MLDIIYLKESQFDFKIDQGTTTMSSWTNRSNTIDWNNYLLIRWHITGEQRENEQKLVMLFWQFLALPRWRREREEKVSWAEALSFLLLPLSSVLMWSGTFSFKLNFQSPSSQFAFTFSNKIWRLRSEAHCFYFAFDAETNLFDRL